LNEKTFYKDPNAVTFTNSWINILSEDAKIFNLARQLK
jgi:hypothetical protein